MTLPIHEVNEGAKIAKRAAEMLLATSNTQKGRSGSDLRRACGDMLALAEIYIVTNTIAQKLATCFEQARVTGATLRQLNQIREELVAIPKGALPWVNDNYYSVGELIYDRDSGNTYKCKIAHTSAATGSFNEDWASAPNNWGDSLSLVAMLIKEACISFCLQQMSLAVVEAEFISRQDVEMVRDEMNAAFFPAEESAADEMAQEVYFKMVKLHAAVTFHLYDTARPLPQMLAYRFSAPRPTLVLSHRLYDTASRADQLREENKIVHPAFAPREGRALAF